MTDAARNKALATQARRVYLEHLVRGMVPLASTLNNTAAQLLLLPAEYPVMVARRDAVQSWNRRGQAWQSGFVSSLRRAAVNGVPQRLRPESGGRGALSLVDDDTIERQITGSRLTLAMMDKVTWEFTDLRTRMQMLEHHEELDANDLLRAQVIADLVLDSWHACGLDIHVWHMLQNELHEEFAGLIGEAYHEVNRWLVAQNVMPEVDLRPFIRRSAGGVALGLSHASADLVAGAGQGRHQTVVVTGMGGLPSAVGELQGAGGQLVDASAPGQSLASVNAREVLAQLQRVLQRHIPNFGVSAALAPTTQSGTAGNPPARAFAPTAVQGLPAAVQGVQGVQGLPAAHPGSNHAGLVSSAAATGSAVSQATGSVAASPRLSAAIRHAQEVLQHRPGAQIDLVVNDAPRALEDIKARQQAFKQVLKQAADTPGERATIEIVAMMFQSLLTEERLPATVRVWFARLQMPVLRVAVSEPDFFATTDHPARQLIDRMGSCVMGFSASTAGEGAVSTALEREIKRVVQVVEAYPDTGRRVFATVLTEFEKFLAHYFEKENQASMRGVSLAQQIEERETMAIQYTIELRKMLNEVPVQDGVREFLFHVWADVLAVTAMRMGAQDEETKSMKRAAADLIWSASAKVSRDERAEVIRRLPPLLKTLRDGMAHAGLSTEKQDQHVRALNNALAAAFTAKTASIPQERLDELMEQLEQLEALLPEEGSDDARINDSIMRDLSGHEAEGMEVVSEGGTQPTAGMLAWARELPVGGWYKLDYRGRIEVVQLAWRGVRRNLTLFVTPGGRGVLFQVSRMASFLQAGLLQPAQDELLTVKATRSALEKLEADPSRLLN
ncbi:MAG: DUF1631 family protein [Paucibacter sp.]|nr:DUF1631 family protein [Roseateles sp.]